VKHNEMFTGQLVRHRMFHAWGVGYVEDVRVKDLEGRGTQHRYLVRWTGAGPAQNPSWCRASELRRAE
jgi:hypothetical protein